MITDEARRAWYAELAEQFGRSAYTEIHLGWDGGDYYARLAAHFGRLALGQNVKTWHYGTIDLNFVMIYDAVQWLNENHPEWDVVSIELLHGHTTRIVYRLEVEAPHAD